MQSCRCFCYHLLKHPMLILTPQLHQEKTSKAIPDLCLSSIALQSRWLWLQQADESHAWAELPLTVPRDVESFFQASTYTIIGDGRSTAFWTGRWIQDQAVKHIAPCLLNFVSRKDIRQTTCRDARGFAKSPKASWSKQQTNTGGSGG